MVLCVDVQESKCIGSASSIMQILISCPALGGLFSCYRPSKGNPGSFNFYASFLRHLWPSRAFLQTICAPGDSILSPRATGGNGVGTAQQL